VTLELFLRGLAIGFAVAVALGPVGLLVIRRTLDRGWAYGFLSGVGVATADATYGAIAAFGLTAITEALVGADRFLGIAGGVVLLGMAARGLRATLRSDGTAPVARPDPSGLDRRFAGWASMVALTLTNPTTILSFAALFASIGAGTGGPSGAAAVVAGVFLGSVAWWAILTGAVSALRARLTPRVVRGLNLAAAVIIAAFGVGAIVLGLSG
jgi:threonine/homoserine/homoserine lactone efflux protein